MASAGHQAVYAYRFDWDEGGKFLWTDLSKVLGAAHSIEIPFVLNRFKFLGDADKVMWRKKTEQSRQKLSRAMGSYWASFARTGEPSSDALPAWPTFGQEAKLIYFDSDNDAGIRVEAGADNFEHLVNDLKADTRLTETERCEIAKGLQEWRVDLSGALATFEGCR